MHTIGSMDTLLLRARSYHTRVVEQSRLVRGCRRWWRWSRTSPWGCWRWSPALPPASDRWWTV